MDVVTLGPYSSQDKRLRYNMISKHKGKSIDVHSSFTRSNLSETSIEYRFADAISLEASRSVLSLFYTLQDTLDKERWHVQDILPTYTTITLFFTIQSPLFDQNDLLDDIIKDALIHPRPYPSRSYEIHVSYRGEDLPYLCDLLNLSQDELIKLHTNRPYPIAMLGFRPFFPYLLGLDERLNAPRRKEPRIRVKKGSVAIGGAQTGIYSEDSPGGWHIIGYTDFEDFSLLQPGDILEFVDKEKRC